MKILKKLDERSHYFQETKKHLKKYKFSPSFIFSLCLCFFGFCMFLSLYVFRGAIIFL